MQPFSSSAKQPPPVRFGSETNMWGVERVGFTPVKEWDEHVEQGTQLLDKCEVLYQNFSALYKKPSENETL